MAFWEEFWKESREMVNQVTVLGTVLTALGSLVSLAAMVMGVAGFYHHCWTLGKGLDGAASQVILGLAGAGGLVGSAGGFISRFSSTTVSKVEESVNSPPAPPGKPLKPV